MSDVPTTDDAPAPVQVDPIAPPSQQVEALAAEQAGVAPETLTVRDEQFTLAAAIPAIVMLRLAAVTDGKATPAKMMSAIESFLERVIHADDRDRFMALLEDAEPPIDFDELNGIIEAAVEVIGARPTEP
jgi:hypothetical protein